MRRTTRIGALVAATGLVSAALWAPTATAEISEPFGGSASSEFLHANVHAGALSADAPEVIDLGLSQTTADADSPDGLGDGVLTHASGTNLSAALGGEQLPQLVETIEQSAPPDNAEPNSGSLIPLSEASPLLTGDVLPSTALARDPAAISCPSDGGRTTVSEGTSAVTDLSVLDLAELSGDDTMGPLVSASDMEGNGTLETTSGLYIGPNGEVISETATPAVQLSIAGQVDVEVLDPVLTATATGTPGGASVDYSAEVRLADEVIATGEENSVDVPPLRDALAQLDSQALDQIFGPLDENALEPLTDQLTGNLPLFEDGPVQASELINEGVVTVEQLVEFLDPTAHVRVNEVTRDIADDGTSASGSTDGVVVDLTVTNTLTGTETELVSVNLGAMSAEANVAAGGIDCGGLPSLTVEKDGPQTVQPGDTFEYTIDVTNTTGCDVTDAVVTDEITGPDGFEVVSTDPEADSVSGGTVTWETGEMAQGETASYTVTIQVPDDAGGESFSDTATADGNCEDQALPRGEDTLDGPDVQEGQTPSRAAEPDEGDSLPRTGGGGLAMLGLGAVALASRLRGRS